MENIIAESESNVVGGFEYGIENLGRYVIDRRQVSYAPSGSNIYSVGAGNRQIKFHLTASDTNSYLDLSSIRIFANLKNNEAGTTRYLRFIGQLHSCFSRLRVMVGGQIVEDITDYNKFCEIWNCLKSPDARDLDDIESGMNPRYDDDFAHTYATGLQEDVAGAGNWNKYGDLRQKFTRHSMAGIYPQSWVRLGHQCCSGFLNSGYYLPLRHASGLEIELTLVNDANDPIIVPVASGGTNTDANNYFFTEGNTGVDWELNSLALKADIAVLDPKVSEKYTEGLLSGGSMKILYKSYHMTSQTIANGTGEINLNIVKSATRLDGMFVTLYRKPRTEAIFSMNNESRFDRYIFKKWNYFYNPMINYPAFSNGTGATGNEVGYGYANKNLDLTFDVLLGNKRYPEVASSSLSEHMYYLRRFVSLLNPDQDSMSIKYNQYRANKFIMGINFQKMDQNNLTGVNSKLGALLTLNIRGTNANLTGTEEAIEEITTCLVSSNILEIMADTPMVHT